MKVYHQLDEIQHIPSPVITTGTFDGVHLGHIKILENLREAAVETGGETVLFTFYPHPRMVIFPDDNDLKLLNTQEEKISRLRTAGVDHLIIFPFTRDFSRLSALEFVRDILVGRIGMKMMVIGYDHQFGKNREGNLEHLTELAPVFDFRVREIPARDVDQVNVSSTKIRKALLEGDIETANSYLGYRYMLSGKVVRGRQLGRELGFPTANISVPYRHKLIPATGIYAVTVRSEGIEYGGMLSIGYNPTVTDNGDITIEVNIFDFNKDIYDSEITVEFVARLRDEVRFPGLAELKRQLYEDQKSALRALYGR